MDNHSSNTRVSHADIRAKFCDFTRALVPGLASGDIILDGDVHRFPIDGDKRRDSGWYSVHIDGARPVGVVGSWKGAGEHHVWVLDGDTRPMTAEERQSINDKIERGKAARAARDRSKRDQAAARAADLWYSAKPAPADHPYLVRKGVPPYGIGVSTWKKWDREARAERVVSENALLIPLQNADGEIRSVQAIMPDSDNWLGRNKDFPFGAEKSGLYYPIGVQLERDSTAILLIGEGFATCATVRLATGYPTIMAIDAGNLMAVGKVMRKLHPRANIVFCADDDCHLPDNPGLTKAYGAAYAIGGRVAEPKRRPKD